MSYILGFSAASEPYSSSLIRTVPVKRNFTEGNSAICIFRKQPMSKSDILSFQLFRPFKA